MMETGELHRVFHLTCSCLKWFTICLGVFMDMFQILVNSWENLGNEIAVFLPHLLWALLILVVGWAVARLLRRGATEFLKIIRLNMIAEKAGIEAVLQKGGTHLTTITLIAGILYWFVIFVTALAALNMLGMGVADELFRKAMLYVPNVVVAVLVLVLGSFVAKVVGSIFYTYLNNIGFGSAKILAVTAKYGILVFAVFIALEHLAIGGAILTSAFQLAFGAVCLAAAIAFGFGGKEVASKVLDRLWQKWSGDHR